VNLALIGAGYRTNISTLQPTMCVTPNNKRSRLVSVRDHFTGRVVSGLIRFALVLFSPFVASFASLCL
jgi:hypothetical protein